MLQAAEHTREDTTVSTLVNDIARTSRISADQARLALGTVLSFLGSRLPSPVMGRIQEAMRDDGPSEGHDRKPG